MSNVKGLSKNIPSKELPFQIKSVGNVTQEAYEGSFVVKVPQTRDRSKIGIELAKLNGGVRFDDLDDSTALLHNAVAYLRVLLLDAPDWFVQPEEEGGMAFGLDTLDSNVAVDVFLAANAEVIQWQKALKGQADDKPKKGRKTGS